MSANCLQFLVCLSMEWTMKSIYKRLCVFVIPHVNAKWPHGFLHSDREQFLAKANRRKRRGSWKRASPNQTLSLAEFALIRCDSDVGIPAFWVSPFPKPNTKKPSVKSPLVIWAYLVSLTLTQIAKVIWEGDAHITRVLGMVMPKTQGYPYHCNIATELTFPKTSVTSHADGGLSPPLIQTWRESLIQWVSGGAKFVWLDKRSTIAK